MNGTGHPRKRDHLAAAMHDRGFSPDEISVALGYPRPYGIPLACRQAINRALWAQPANPIAARNRWLNTGWRSVLLYFTCDSCGYFDASTLIPGMHVPAEIATATAQHWYRCPGALTVQGFDQTGDSISRWSS